MALRIEGRNKSKSFIQKMLAAKDRSPRPIKYPSDMASCTLFATKTPTVENVKTLKIFVGTWNVGGKCPENGLALDDFLQVHSPSDIYVLGFQEIVPLNAGNVLVIEDSEPAARWLALINQTLNGPHSTVQSLRKAACPKYSLKAMSKQLRTESKRKLKMCTCVSDLERKNSRDSCFWCQPNNVSQGGLSSEEEEGPDGVIFSEVTNYTVQRQKYSLVVSKQMVGIFLSIWVKRDLVQHVSHLRTACISRGILGLGNKGCISVSMLLYQTSFCFICSHLASGEKEGDEIRRNFDVVEILRNTQFPRRCRVPNTCVPERILEHDQIIWLGDLNYRIALSQTEAMRLVKKHEWETLLSKDQLKMEMDAGRVFKGWREGLIKFAPTYKYSYNSDTYLGEANIPPNKRRTPAWCDRILWKGVGIHQLSYERKDSNKYRFSDHRPVYAIFSVEVSVRGTSNSNLIKIEVEELLPSQRSI